MFERWCRSVGVDLFDLLLASARHPWYSLLPKYCATLIYCCLDQKSHVSLTHFFNQGWQKGVLDDVKLLTNSFSSKVCKLTCGTTLRCLGWLLRLCSCNHALNPCDPPERGHQYIIQRCFPHHCYLGWIHSGDSERASQNYNDIASHFSMWTVSYLRWQTTLLRLSRPCSSDTRRKAYSLSLPVTSLNVSIYCWTSFLFWQDWYLAEYRGKVQVNLFVLVWHRSAFSCSFFNFFPTKEHLTTLWYIYSFGYFLLATCFHF